MNAPNWIDRAAEDVVATLATDPRLLLHDTAHQKAVGLVRKAILAHYEDPRRIEEAKRQVAEMVEKLDFEMKPFHVIENVNDFGLANLKAEVVKQSFSHWLQLRLTAYIVSFKLADYEFRAPVDWIEALKAHFAPAWLLKKWPLGERVERIEAVALYPSIPLLEKKPYLVALKKAEKKEMPSGGATPSGSLPAAPS